VSKPSALSVIPNDKRPPYPIASSSEDSSGVPQRRQITAEQSPQVRGSFTCFAQTGQYKTTADGIVGTGCGGFSIRTEL
jgi:hypothetical protein